VTQRILVVGSPSKDMLQASALLGAAGYEVQPADDSTSALALVDEDAPDLILVDASLPETDRQALVRQIRAHTELERVPLLALAESAVEGAAQSAHQAGLNGYVARPSDDPGFVQRIAAYLGNGSNSKTILIVDDAPAHLELLRLQLKAEGHAVLTASNGIEALEILEGERERVAGIVSDVLMPQMDGYSLCLQVRKNPRYACLPFVLYSGTHDTAEDQRLANAVGADAFVEKPAAVQKILAGLGNASGAHRRPAVPLAIPELQAPVLKQYSESLVRKLEEKSAELAQTEARLTGMVEAALDGIVTVNDRQNVVLFNYAAEKMFGYPRAEALGRTLSTFIPARLHDARGRQVGPFGISDTGSRRVGVRVVWGRRRDGTEFPIESSVAKLETPQGRLYTAFLRDITDRHRAEQALARSEAALRHAQELAKLAHIVTGPEGALEDSAGTLAQFLDVEPPQIPTTNRAWLRLVHPDDRLLVRERAMHAARTQLRIEVEYRLRRGSGWIHIHHVMDPLPALRKPLPQRVSWFHTLQDVTDRKEATFRIRRLNRVLSVLSAINALIVRSIDRDELLREACRIAVDAGQFPKAWIGLLDPDSGALQVAAGYGASEAFYASLRQLLRDDVVHGRSHAAKALRTLEPVVANDLHQEQRQLTDALESGSRAAAMLPLIIDGKAVGVLTLHAEVTGFFDDDEMKLLCELAADIAFALAHLRKSEQLQYLANYDPVTNLPNRGLFSERLSLALQKWVGVNAILAVVLIDVERFRRINETLGRAVGDQLLQLLARRLQQANASAARIAGDVFAFEVQVQQSVTEVARAFEELVKRCFGSAFKLADEELLLSCRGGVAVFPSDGADAESLLRNAETALRRAKGTSERIAFYAPDINARAAEALTMESRLRRAIERNEFVLYYQPKIALADRSICGVEALIRWRDPSGGLVLPGRLIPVLEESGQIGTVGQWALGQAVADHQRWHAAGLAAPRVAVNVSALQLRDPDFAAIIASVVAGHQSAALELEITESMIMEQVDRSIAALRQIRALGVTVAIDDFGTGYCSLSYVAKLPVTSLKIDRAFIVGMTEGPEGLAIVSSMIALAHSLKLKVVAEGVETAEQERLLRLLGCDEAQGYLFSQPVPFVGMEELLRGARKLSA
jgi:diguanylate cyclase (GGDEF)-like protein/PAS domain S-box-containing protein